MELFSAAHAARPRGNTGLYPLQLASLSGGGATPSAFDADGRCFFTRLSALAPRLKVELSADGGRGAPIGTLVVRFRCSSGGALVQSRTRLCIEAALEDSRGARFRVVVSSQFTRGSLNELHAQLPLLGLAHANSPQLEVLPPSPAPSASPGGTPRWVELSLPLPDVLAIAGKAQGGRVWHLCSVEVTGHGSDVCSVGLLPREASPSGFPHLFFRPTTPCDRLRPSADLLRRLLLGGGSSHAEMRGRDGGERLLGSSTALPAESGRSRSRGSSNGRGEWNASGKVAVAAFPSPSVERVDNVARRRGSGALSSCSGASMPQRDRSLSSGVGGREDDGLTSSLTQLAPPPTVPEVGDTEKARHPVAPRTNTSVYVRPAATVSGPSLHISPHAVNVHMSGSVAPLPPPSRSSITPTTIPGPPLGGGAAAGGSDLAGDAVRRLLTQLSRQLAVDYGSTAPPTPSLPASTPSSAPDTSTPSISRVRLRPQQHQRQQVQQQRQQLFAFPATLAGGAPAGGTIASSTEVQWQHSLPPVLIASSSTAPVAARGAGQSSAAQPNPSFPTLSESACLDLLQPTATPSDLAADAHQRPQLLVVDTTMGTTNSIAPAAATSTSPHSPSTPTSTSPHSPSTPAAYTPLFRPRWLSTPLGLPSSAVSPAAAHVLSAAGGGERAGSDVTAGDVSRPSSTPRPLPQTTPLEVDGSAPGAAAAAAASAATPTLGLTGGGLTLTLPAAVDRGGDWGGLTELAAATTRLSPLALARAGPNGKVGLTRGAGLSSATAFTSVLPPVGPAELDRAEGASAGADSGSEQAGSTDVNLVGVDIGTGRARPFNSGAATRGNTISIAPAPPSPSPASASAPSSSSAWWSYVQARHDLIGAQIQQAVAVMAEASVAGSSVTAEGAGRQHQLARSMSGHSSTGGGDGGGWGSVVGVTVPGAVSVTAMISEGRGSRESWDDSTTTGRGSSTKVGAAHLPFYSQLLRSMQQLTRAPFGGGTSASASTASLSGSHEANGLGGGGGTGGWGLQRVGPVGGGGHPSGASAPAAGSSSDRVGAEVVAAARLVAARAHMRSLQQQRHHIHIPLVLSSQIVI